MNLKNLLLNSSVRNLFSNERFSDFTMDIIESNTSLDEARYSKVNRKRKFSESHVEPSEDDQHLLCSLPVHSLILSMQCEYFEKLFDWALKNSKKKVEIKTNKDEGHCFKLFVQSLYDSSILRNLEPIDLYQVIKAADKYLCDGIIKEALEAISSLKFKSFGECLNLVDNLPEMNTVKTLKNVVNSFFFKCSVYACTYFCPLEEKFHELESEFKNIPFNLLLAMLKCKQPITFHENSMLFFILLWLEHNESRQASKYIELLLFEINSYELTKEYLIDIITEDHPVLIKSPRFYNWFVTIVSGNDRPCLLTTQWKSGLTRSFKGQNGLTIFKVHFTKSNSKLFNSDRTFVYNGYHFSPSVTVSNSRRSNRKVLKLNFKCLNFVKKYVLGENCKVELACFKAGIAIQYGNAPRSNVFPDYRDVDENYLICCPLSLEAYKTKISCYLNMGTISHEYYERFNEFDLFISLIDAGANWPLSFPEVFDPEWVAEFVIEDENTIR